MANNQRWLNLAKSILSPLIDSLFKGKSGGGQQPRQGSGSRGSGQAAPKPGGPRPQRPSGSQRPSAPRPSQGGSRDVSAAEAAQRGAAYAGDYSGRLNPVYSPEPDGQPDPGEVVWAWVPYEEDHSQGKDRPVLIVGRNGGLLLALMLTSKDHTREHDRDYIDVGTGAWDRQGRPSEAKLDRVLQLDESSVRREGAVLSRERFEAVAHALRSR
ncbi:type II toxin-antitoxin system PemK/MazF family toxin [Galactobacter valiniphilus]|uniref:type II toxin-antitoxin system PemK/MazF family toxin n=1 Tax=Galactobacter valiniphilus TaxID=2676122 RepID=UPI00373699CE